jgi:hypothetical protein
MIKKVIENKKDTQLSVFFHSHFQAANISLHNFWNNECINKVANTKYNPRCDH